MNFNAKQRRSWKFYVSILGVSLCGFIITATQIHSTPSKLENSVYNTLTQLRTPTLTKMMIDITALGSFSVLLFFSIFLLAFLLIMKKRMHALFIIANTAGALLLPHYFKTFFQRTRPNSTEHLVDVITWSFPSGHAWGSTSIYLGFAYLVLAYVVHKKMQRLLNYALIALILLICISRIYLGVHFFYDVMAGIFLGLAWTSICILLLFHRPVKS